MRILLLNQFFHPDLSAVAQLAADLAEDLVAAGHRVTALAARGSYLGGQRLPARERWHGVDIVRTGATAFGKGSLGGRIADYASFYASALASALALPRHDVVLATTAPPLVASIGAAVRAARGSRFVYWMQDVYPELAIEFGVLGPRSPMTWIFERISRATLRRADGVVVLGEAMAGRIEGKGVDRARIHVVPNWSDGRTIRPIDPATNNFRREHGLHGRKVVLYSGNMGRGHDLGTVLEAARRLRGERDVVFVFIGDGAKRAEVEAAARETPSIVVLPYQPRERLAESLSAADVHVVTMDPRTLGLLEPSKLYGVLAVARPALVVGPAEAEVAQTVLREGVGEVVRPGDVEGAVAALRRLLDGAIPLGARARVAFDRAYDRRHRTAALEAILAGRASVPFGRAGV